MSFASQYFSFYGNTSSLVEFIINSEKIRLKYHSMNNLKELEPDFSNRLLFFISSRNGGYSLGEIICKNIVSIKALNLAAFYNIELCDNEKNRISIYQSDVFGDNAVLFQRSWKRLMRLLEINLFPHLVNNIVKEILEQGEYEICKSYRLKVTISGIYLEGKFIVIENVVCKINFKNWELKISNKKNIFQGRKISISGENIIIMPYLIDYLKIIHNQ